MGIFSKKTTTKAKEPKRRYPVIVPYSALDGFRWRMIASNGKIVAESGEAYVRFFDCKNAIERFQRTAMLAKAQELEKTNDND